MCNQPAARFISLDSAFTTAAAAAAASKHQPQRRAPQCCARAKGLGCEGDEYCKHCGYQIGEAPAAEGIDERQLAALLHGRGDGLADQRRVDAADRTHAFTAEGR
jgi:hypothetical protein